MFDGILVCCQSEEAQELLTQHMELHILVRYISSFSHTFVHPVYSSNPPTCCISVVLISCLWRWQIDLSWPDVTLHTWSCPTPMPAAQMPKTIRWWFSTLDPPQVPSIFLQCRAENDLVIQRHLRDQTNTWEGRLLPSHIPILLFPSQHFLFSHCPISGGYKFLSSKN